MSSPAFDFVPVEPDASVMSEPGWHDGSQPDRLSGEIRCTLKALTPLLVGCHQFEMENAVPELQNAFKALVGKRAQVPPNAVSPDNRKVLEPLMAAGESGPVLLPGSSLKGMLRHSLGSLLASPIERANERRFTQRPNMNLNGGGGRRIVPAVVTEVGADGAVTGIRCVPYQNLRYRWDDPHTLNSRASDQWDKIMVLPANARRASYNGNAPAREVCLTEGNEKWALVRSHRGLDHEGELDREFLRQNPAEGNRRPLPEFVGVRLENGDWPVAAKAFPSKLPEEVFKAYKKTQETLADRKFGHLRDHPLVHQADIDSGRLEKIRNRILHPWFEVGDLVFLEMVVSFGQRNQVLGGRIVAMGHYLRYRWGATDSVQRTGILGGSPALRKEIKPKDDEVANGAPKRLSAARLLFGYASPGKDHESPEWPTSHGIGFDKEKGETDHGKLAGRVAINHAVEVVSPGGQRFLNPGESFLVPLRAQGSPKPSFALDYLNQNPGTTAGATGGSGLRTWGDALDVPGAPIAGRKHYWHQGDAPPFELVNRNSPDWKLGNGLAIQAKFSLLARHVSVGGTCFRFTIRFRDLTERELGALLFALSPDGASATAMVDVFRNRVSALTNIPAQRALEGHGLLGAQWKDSTFGHKLGHGRSLGMGSVQVAIDSVKIIGNPPAERPGPARSANEWLGAFLKWLSEVPADKLGKQMDVAKKWLDLRKLDGRVPRTPRNLEETAEIWLEHSRERRN